MNYNDDILSTFNDLGIESSEDEYLNTSTNQTKKRTSCENCKRPETACICDSLPDTKYTLKATKIVMLQHPFEVKRPMATEPIIQKVINLNADDVNSDDLDNSLNGVIQNLDINSGSSTSRAVRNPENYPYVFIRCKLYKEKRYESVSKMLLDNKEYVKILFPTDAAVCLDRKVKSFTGNPIKDSETEDIYSKTILVVLDGTWRQAKWMYQNSPFLHQFSTVIVKNNKISDYLIRTQPTEESLCTLEAVCLALVYLGEDDELEEKLRNPLKRLCEIQIGFGAVTHKSKQYNLANGLIDAELLPKRNKKVNRHNKLIEDYKMRALSDHRVSRDDGLQCETLNEVRRNDN